MESRDDLEMLALDQEPRPLFEVDAETSPDGEDSLSELKRLARGTYSPAMPTGGDEVPHASAFALLHADPVLPGILGDLSQPKTTSPTVKLLAGAVVLLVGVIVVGGAVLLRGDATHGGVSTPAAEPTVEAIATRAAYASRQDAPAHAAVAALEKETIPEVATDTAPAADEPDLEMPVRIAAAEDDNEDRIANIATVAVAAAPEPRAMPHVDDEVASKDTLAVANSNDVDEDESTTVAAADDAAAPTPPPTPAPSDDPAREGLPKVAKASPDDGQSIDDLLDRSAGDLESEKEEAAPTRTGISKQELKTAMASIHAKLMGCALRNEVVGLTKIRFTIDPDGKVKRAKAVGHDGTTYSSCVSERVRTLAFDPFDGAPKTITYPVLLK